jgi:uncharacterized membrane protein
MVETNAKGFFMTTNTATTPTTESPRRLTSRITLTGVMWISLVFGILVTSYLSYLKASSVPAVCVVGSVFNCGAVLNSAYSVFMGIPIAYLGLFMYLTLSVILFFEHRVSFLQEYGKILMFGIGLFAWLFSMYLVYLQFFVLGALCPWCLSHETNMTILFAMLCYRLWRDMNAPVEA